MCVLYHMKEPRIQKVSGMRDILPAEQLRWRSVERAWGDIAEFYAFRRIDTPLLEQAELFIKGTGETSEIVQKQMYTLKTGSGDMLVLRPEGTPSIIRAYLEHGMTNWPSPVKLYYTGPMFRRERPQAGRYRQFHQFGVEAIGEQDAVLDVQIIQMFATFFKAVKVGDIVVHINSIGDMHCRPRYKKILKDYYRPKLKQVCADCRERYKTNPLRMLDCKEEKCQPAIHNAPPILDYLCEECHNHFKEVLELVESTGIPYFVNPHLVRGLDYYTKTVFEIYQGDGHDADSHQPLLALAAGGRYDGLIKLLGGKDTPAVGGAIGMERIMGILEKKGVFTEKELTVPVFLVQLGDLAKKTSLALVEQFREARIPIQESLGRASIKSQLRIANRAGARYALILGQKEAIDNTVIVREMENGIQETVPLEKIIPFIKNHLARKTKVKK